MLPSRLRPVYRQLLATSSRKMSSNDAKQDEVLFKIQNNKGIISLNREKALNSLTLNMVQLMYKQLKAWEGKVDMVIVEGMKSGKSFCAGGDVRAITASRGTQNQRDFFREEYLLNNLTSTLPVPYVALIDGIVMGGGVGISVHGPVRVATERTLFAMPETGIGLIPDVGGSYFLPRLNGELGMYLAITGDRLKGLDCLFAGIATHMCPGDKMEDLKKELIDLKNTSSLHQLLDSYSSKLSRDKEFSLKEKLPLINECFSAESVESILDRLNSSGGDWGKGIAEMVRSKFSPTSVKLTFKQMREGKKLGSLAECLQMEYRLVRRVCENDDFYEGVRALLVDKDNSPMWNPPTLETVSEDFVDTFFSRLPENEELKF